MSTKTKDTTADDTTRPLSDLDINELRKLATTVYRIVLTRDMSEADIRKAIEAKKKKSDYAELAELVGGAPKPGYARILVHKDPSPGASNRPVPLGINGYRIAIPRGIEVDVPIKVVGVLNDAKVSVLREDTSLAPNDPGRFKFESAHSYPFSLITMTPGPDPRPGYEQNREKQMRPRVKFRDKYGYWPRKEELREAMRRGDLDDIIKD